jgi:hypothetical protein
MDNTANLNDNADLANPVVVLEVEKDDEAPPPIAAVVTTSQSVGHYPSTVDPKFVAVQALLRSDQDVLRSIVSSNQIKTFVYGDI